jgi:hypothetical protein
LIGCNFFLFFSLSFSFFSRFSLHLLISWLLDLFVHTFFGFDTVKKEKGSVIQRLARTQNPAAKAKEIGGLIGGELVLAFVPNVFFSVRSFSSVTFDVCLC